MPELDHVLQRFPSAPDHCGLLALVEGRVLGLAILSRPQVYCALHTCLLRSYVMGAHTPAQHAFEGEPTAFVKAALSSHQTRRSSTGLGEDHRYEADGIVGSALTFKGKVVHMTFFHVPQDDALAHELDRRNGAIHPCERARQRHCRRAVPLPVHAGIAGPCEAHMDSTTTGLPWLHAHKQTADAAHVRVRTIKSIRRPCDSPVVPAPGPSQSGRDLSHHAQPPR